MASRVKIKAREDGGKAMVHCVMTHPMESGLRRHRATGEAIPAHYITEVACEHNGSIVVRAYLGPAVARNPSLTFEIRDAKKGDRVKVTWWDTRMKSVAGETTIV